MIGTKLAHYEITSHLGSGGMGDVYQATDSRLGRSVAVKLLPAAFASDPERLSRFRREAQVLASLNHPNIAHIYGLEESGETRCIVMELVEGETLQARIQRGPIPVDEAMAIAKQIADALEAAHERGIVHRDLKPGNVMLTADGKVKVLDFGLAKSYEASPSNPSMSNSPTMAGMAATNAGVILGTAAYMSPEQARGKVVDKRADIWAFGVVLYEMVTGRQLFQGEDQTVTLASVVMKEPDFSGAPERVRRVLERCLEKDPKKRMRDISSVELLLDEPSPPVAAATDRAARLPWAVAAVLAVVLAIASWALWREMQPSGRPVERLSIVTPNPIGFTGNPSLALAISPDGNDLVYVGENPDVRPSRAQLYIRSLQDLKVRPLPGTEGGVQPFFSPDGKWIGFFTFTGELKKVALAGGNPVTLADHLNASRWSRGVWVDSGTIVFGHTDGLQRISSSGGKPEKLTSIDRTQGERRHDNPQLLPGTHTVLFDIIYENGRDPKVEALALDSGERRLVVEKAAEPLYLDSGHLLFKRDDVVMVAPFDPKKLTMLGPGVPILDKVRDQGRAQMVVSPGGTMVYIPESEGALQTLGSVGVDGMFQPFPGLSPNKFSRPRVSPNGQSLAFEVQEGLNSKVEVYDLRRGTTAKLTQEGSDAIIAWHPNGKEIAVFSQRQNAAGIFLKDLNGRERLLVTREAGSVFRPGSWSPDGKVLAYVIQKGSSHDIWLASEQGKSAPRAFLNTPASEYLPMFSPDGKWLAYVSDRSGHAEVYVRPYPEGDDIPVSAGGGEGPVWRPDGKAIFYESRSDPARPLMTVSVNTDGRGLRLGDPVKVLDALSLGPAGDIERFRFAQGWPGNEYDTFPEGKRFVTSRSPDPRSREIVVVQNWLEELKQRVPLK